MSTSSSPRPDDDDDDDGGLEALARELSGVSLGGASSPTKAAAAGMPPAATAPPASTAAPSLAPLAAPTFKPLRPYQAQVIAYVQRAYLGLCACPCDAPHLRAHRQHAPVRCDGSAPTPPSPSPSSSSPSSSLLYLPTGGGKTRVAAELARWCARDCGGRLLFVVNRAALVTQAKKAFEELGVGGEGEGDGDGDGDGARGGRPRVGVIAAGYPDDPHARVQIATIQSLSARARRAKISADSSGAGSPPPTGKASPAASPASSSSSDSSDAFSDTDDDEDDEDDSANVDKDKGKTRHGDPPPRLLRPGTVDDGAFAAASKAASALALAFPKADLVIVDEAHGAVARTYTRLLDFYRVGAGASRTPLPLTAAPPASASSSAAVAAAASSASSPSPSPPPSLSHRHTFILGLTATPIRLREEEKLSRVFEGLIRGPSVSDLVAASVLVPPLALRASTEEVRATLARAPQQLKAAAPSARGGRGGKEELRASASRRAAWGARGDDDDDEDDDDEGGGGGSNRGGGKNGHGIDDAAVAAAVTSAASIAHAVASWRTYCAGRRTIVFASDVAHSQSLAAAFLDAGIPAAHVDGTIPMAARDRIYASVARGTTLVLSSVNVISEGFDEPTVSAVLLLRPTHSRGLYVQQVGRGLRSAPWAGKRDCIVLDFVDNTLRHGPVTRPIASDLDAGAGAGAGVGAGLPLPRDGGRAWVCNASGCPAIMHPLSPTCVRCGAPKPLPKVKGGAAAPAAAAAQGAPAWATALVASSAAASAAAGSTAAAPELLKIPRKIVPGLALATARVAAVATAAGGAAVAPAPAVPVRVHPAPSAVGAPAARAPAPTPAPAPAPAPVTLRPLKTAAVPVAVLQAQTLRDGGGADVDALTAAVGGLRLSSSSSTTTTTTTTATPVVPVIPRLSSAGKPPAVVPAAAAAVPAPAAGSSPAPVVTHAATPATFADPGFSAACARHGLRSFDASAARTAWEAEFLLSVAALLTPGVAHSWKRVPAESRGLSAKQREILDRILLRAQASSGKSR
jgi:superfamily II DNA or RNA helicase